MADARILIVDDDEFIRQALDDELVERGFRTRACGSACEALGALGEHDWDVVVTDVRMPSVNGIQLCEHIVENYPGLPVVVMTAYGDVTTVVSAMRAAAFDFLRKPFTVAELLGVVSGALERRHAGPMLAKIAHAGMSEDTLGLLGSSPVMRDLRHQVARFALSDSTVLVTGESGTGKELIARAIHRHGGRRDGPFIAVNCAAIPSGVLLSEFFGHARGAFTDAGAAHPGLFFQADGGTLFLDEIGAMPLELQPVLLRALEERAVRQVGGTAELGFDVRIVAATNRDLNDAVRDGVFRADLLFRLNVLKIHAPPLRERGDDLVELMRHFLRQTAASVGAAPPTLTPAAVAALEQHRWPGNVRELQNCAEAAFAFAADGRVDVDDLPTSVRECSQGPGKSGEHSLEEVERLHIERALNSTAFNKAEAARVLGIDRTTLYRKMQRLGIDRLRRA